MAYTFRHGDRPLDDFTIQRAVGRGGFGEVYYAVSDGGREVALKYLRDNPDVELRGVSHCINLKSPHLVSIFDVKKNAEGEYFIIMEYVSGPSLRDLLIAEPKGLGPQKAAFFLREIAKGLSYLHDRGIVHRDLKPGNIFYDEGYVKIGDYGLSKFISVSRHSAQTASVGTVHYMAPEVGSGNYHRGIDIYALGVILYEMLLGKVPFEGSSMGEVLMKHLTEQPELDELPAPFGKIVRKALQKDPQERYQSVYEMVDDLMEVGDIRTSLAGFNPASLSAAVRRPADELDSPAPSPNPPPRAPGRPPMRAAGARPRYDLDARRLPARMAKRIEQVSQQVERRVQTLDRKHGRRARRPSRKERRAERREAGQAQRAASDVPKDRKDTIQRILLATAMAVGLGVLIGLFAGGREEVMASSIMSIAGLAGGLALGCRAVALMSRTHAQPRWVERLSMAIPVAALTGIGIAPFSEAPGGHGAAGVWFTYVVFAFLANWRHKIRVGARGELSIWAALWMGFLAFILAIIFTGDDRCARLAGGVVVAATLVFQALSWLFPLGTWLDGRTVATPATAGAGASYDRAPPAGPSAVDEPASAPTRDSYLPRVCKLRLFVPGCCESTDALELKGALAATTQPPRHWLVTRLFGALVSLGSLAGIMLCIMFLVEGHTSTAVSWSGVNGVGSYAVSVRHCVDDEITVAAAAGGLFGLMLFGFGKVPRYRSGGFYRESFRPLLRAAALAGLAGAIACLRLKAYGHDDVPVKALLALCVAVVILTTVFRGRRYPRPTSAEVNGAADEESEASLPAANVGQR